VIHLIPTLVLIVALSLAWRREWIGAVVYAAMGVLYLVWVTTPQCPVPAATRLGLAMMIAGPAFLIAALFLANWRKHDELRTLRH
jgi:predicted transporter